VIGCLSTDIKSKTNNTIDLKNTVNDSFDIAYDNNGVPQNKENSYVIDISNVPLIFETLYPSVCNATDSDVDLYYLKDSKWKKITKIAKNKSENISSITYPAIKYLGFKYLGNSNYAYKPFIEKGYGLSSITFGLPNPKWEGESSEKIIESIIESSISDLNSPIIIQSLSTSEPNSAGGVSINIDFWNVSGKTIKYVYFDVIPYNRVGDLTTSEITGKSLVCIRVTDFIKPFKSYGASGDCVWYNNSIASFKIESIRIVYTDNSEKSLSSNQIDKILNINPTKYCFYFDDNLSLVFSYYEGRVYCSAIAEKKLDSLVINFETEPKTVFSKFEKDLNIVFNNFNKNDDMINGNSYKEAVINWGNGLLYEIKCINIKYEFNDSEKKEVKIVNPETISEIEKYAYGIESLGLR